MSSWRFVINAYMDAFAAAANDWSDQVEKRRKDRERKSLDYVADVLGVDDDTREAVKFLMAAGIPAVKLRRIGDGYVMGHTVAVIPPIGNTQGGGE